MIAAMSATSAIVSPAAWSIINRLVGSLLLLTPASGSSSVVTAEWRFDHDAEGWTPNAHLARVVVTNGCLCAEAVDDDPMFIRRDLEIPAVPWQLVVVRLRASREGAGELFWTGETTGRYGGFSGEKSTPFNVAGGADSEDIVIFPFWQGEGVIRQLRLDLYNGASFEIDSIRIERWGGAAARRTDVFEWTLEGDDDAWRAGPDPSHRFAPPLDLPVADRPWAAVTLQCERPGAAALVWSEPGGRGPRTAEFDLRPGPEPRTYNLEVGGAPGWNRIAALGLYLPDPLRTRLGSVRLCAEPSGPPDLVVDYLGFENGPVRAGESISILARIRNLGGGPSPTRRPALAVPAAWKDLSAPSPDGTGPLRFGEEAEVRWTVRALEAGGGDVVLRLEDRVAASNRLSVLPPLKADQAPHVPEPRPVRTDIELWAYYFPGWEKDAKWDCIRRVAPVRKPTLGYYDESNPECVDWQIKWAVENGISCFLVDWYWDRGRRHLEHWFDAYRRARHRDRLKVAIMWANHNPPDSHSPDDWRAVTKQWIDGYFGLPAYHRIDGKPAVFIWDPRNIRRDVGGSDVVREMLAESQEMARTAGLPGIAFVAMNEASGEGDMRRLLGEGYFGITTYHEWAGGGTGGPYHPRRFSYEKVVEGAPAAWTHRTERAGRLTYYPVSDTGWDARPWHGDKTLVIEGRTPERFRRLLEEAREFAQARGLKALVLGPLNEWGEGSYIEPNTEFGFEMYEAIRSVFAAGDPRGWPVNLRPRDVGLGPYDYPPQPVVTEWTFDAPAPEWSALMGVEGFAVTNGALRFVTAAKDPAVQVALQSIPARDFTKVELVLRLEGGPLPAGDRGQVFWSADGAAMTERASERFDIAADGVARAIGIDVGRNPRWRDRITTLRLDPCSAPGVTVTVDSVRLVK